MDFSILYLVIILLIILIGFLVFKKIFGMLFRVLVVALLAILILSVIIFFDIKQTYDQYAEGNTLVLVSSENGTLVRAYNFSSKEDFDVLDFNETFFNYTQNINVTPPANFSAIIILKDTEKLSMFNVVLPNEVYVYPQPKSYTWLRKIR